MDETKSQFTNIDEYIAMFPADVQLLMQKIRAVVHEAAPEAEERISYAMPAFYMNGNLVYFGGFKNHIGFFPTSSGINAFHNEFTDYKWSKGTVQFPLDKPIPYDLIRRIVQFRVAEIEKKRPSAKKAVGK